MERREKRNLNITLDNAQMSKSIFTQIESYITKLVTNL